jgi:hypothetical protein
MSAHRSDGSRDAGGRRRRRVAFGAGAALALGAGLAALATGTASVAAPLLVLSYLVLIPAALLA